MKRVFCFAIAFILLLCMFSACSNPQMLDVDPSTDKALEENKSSEVLSEDKSESSEGEESDESDKSGESDEASKDDEASDKSEKHYVRDGAYIYFGEYPQTLKSASVTVGAEADSRGYFLGSDGSYYAKVKATPYESGYKFSNDSALASGIEYYFKVEPIKWRILSEANGKAVVLCESVIASGAYDDATNNYADSNIRAWLNDSFYKTAFNDLEKALIEMTAVDNSAASAGYSQSDNASSNTNDKIYLLSYKEATDESYGFSNASRVKKLSDYARASGAWMSKSEWSEQYGSGLWLLRSPTNNGSTFVRECQYTGEVTDGGTNIASAYFGIVPALTLKLN